MLTNTIYDEDLNFIDSFISFVGGTNFDGPGFISITNFLLLVPNQVIPSIQIGTTQQEFVT
ncbi:MAG: hypothetical protein GY830_06695 [Bacteroidetes bacterium]|nr:hypothetical protein [Bacteroidota bacterium]